MHDQFVNIYYLFLSKEKMALNDSSPEDVISGLDFTMNVLVYIYARFGLGLYSYSIIPAGLVPKCFNK